MHGVTDVHATRSGLGRASVELGSRSEGLGRVFDWPRYKYLNKKKALIFFLEILIKIPKFFQNLL